MNKSIQVIEGNKFVLSIKRLINNIKIKLFGKKKEVVEEKRIVEEKFTTVYTPDSFINQLKIENGKIDKRIEKKDFLKQLDGNVEMLNMLSIDRLKVLESYYAEVIKRNEKKIRMAS